MAGTKDIDGLPPMYSASGPLPPNKRYIFVSANYRYDAPSVLCRQEKEEEEEARVYVKMGVQTGSAGIPGAR